MSPSLLCAFALNPCDFLLHLLNLLLLLSGIGYLLTLPPLLDGLLLFPSSKARRGVYSPFRGIVGGRARHLEAKIRTNEWCQEGRPCMHTPLRLCHLSPLSLLFWGPPTALWPFLSIFIWAICSMLPSPNLVQTCKVSKGDGRKGTGQKMS